MKLFRFLKEVFKDLLELILNDKTQKSHWL